jgi:hypothetical protein
MFGACSGMSPLPLKSSVFIYYQYSLYDKPNQLAAPAWRQKNLKIELVKSGVQPPENSVSKQG